MMTTFYFHENPLFGLNNGSAVHKQALCCIVFFAEKSNRISLHTLALLTFFSLKRKVHVQTKRESVVAEQAAQGALLLCTKKTFCGKNNLLRRQRYK